MKHDHLSLAAALAFYTALSLAPLLIITLSIMALMGQDSQKLLIEQVQNLMGGQAAAAINSVIVSAADRPNTGTLAGIFGVITLLFTASGVFAQLQIALNTIFEVQAKASDGVWVWLRKRLLSMGMVLTLGFLTIVSLVASTALAFIFSQQGSLWSVVNSLITIGVFTLMFGVIYMYLPDRKLDWRSAFLGGLVTSVLFALGKGLIGMYIGKSALGSAYGAAGSLMVLLVWVYYSAAIVFLGAEVMKVLSLADSKKAT